MRRPTNGIEAAGLNHACEKLKELVRASHAKRGPDRAKLLPVSCRIGDMARQTLIDTADDMQWLRDVHLPKLGKSYKSAMITGNEDCPDRIEVYRRRSPSVTDKPVVFEMVGSCTYRRKRSR